MIHHLLDHPTGQAYRLNVTEEWHNHIMHALSVMPPTLLSPPDAFISHPQELQFARLGLSLFLHHALCSPDDCSRTERQLGLRMGPLVGPLDTTAALAAAYWQLASGRTDSALGLFEQAATTATSLVSSCDEASSLLSRRLTVELEGEGWLGAAQVGCHVARWCLGYPAAVHACVDALLGCEI